MSDNANHVQLIDSHAHLNFPEYDSDRAAVISNMYASGTGAIVVGVDIESSQAVAKLARKHDHLWAAVGVHPHDAKMLTKKGTSQLRQLATSNQVIAIGEIGLDYYRDRSPRDQQQSAFRQQLDLATTLDLPIIIHNRDSTNDLLKILDDLDSTHRGVVHSFLGDKDLAGEFLERGFYLGIGGPITFDRNSSLRNAVAAVPLERLLIETDCPFLTPIPYRGKRNEPVYVRYVAEMIAKQKNITIEQVSKVTTQNVYSLFDLEDGE